MVAPRGALSICVRPTARRLGNGEMMLDQIFLERWMAGRSVAEVGFALNEPVVITTGPLAGRVGAIVALVALEPEPVYTVDLGSGREDVHLPESALAAA